MLHLFRLKEAGRKCFPWKSLQCCHAGHGLAKDFLGAAAMARSCDPDPPRGQTRPRATQWWSFFSKAPQLWSSPGHVDGPSGPRAHGGACGRTGGPPDLQREAGEGPCHRADAGKRGTSLARPLVCPQGPLCSQGAPPRGPEGGPS